MAVSDWLMVWTVPKVTLNYSTHRFGDVYAMTGGTSWKEMLYVGSWGSKGQKMCTLSHISVLETLLFCGWIIFGVLEVKRLCSSAPVTQLGCITATLSLNPLE